MMSFNIPVYYVHIVLPLALINNSDGRFFLKSAYRFTSLFKAN